MTQQVWAPDSWKRFRAGQQPDAENGWTDEAVGEATKHLELQPPLIYVGEARRLKDQLARAARGEAFVLQAGDCAETFEGYTANRIRDHFRTLLQASLVLTYSGQMPVVKIGRIAGQFSKPRSAAKETVGDQQLWSYRGDMVNDLHPDPESRVADPQRMITAYHQAAGTLNLLRGLKDGGFADLREVHKWNMEFVASSPEGQRYEQMAGAIDRALGFMSVCGITPQSEPALQRVDYYTSHEALILPYEEALTRQDSIGGENEWFDCSAHMLWVGNRTKEGDGAHVEFLSGVRNPIGVKIDGDDSSRKIVDLCAKLNPLKEPGRLTLISRMGAKNVRVELPRFIEAVQEAGHPVLWLCDPMHGNTFESDSGFKTRRFEDMVDEITGFFEVHHACGTWPGGLHLELTGDDVTECLGGSHAVADEDLPLLYNTACDPRLNAQQSLDLAFRVGELLRR